MPPIAGGASTRTVMLAMAVATNSRPRRPGRLDAVCAEVIPAGSVTRRLLLPGSAMVAARVRLRGAAVLPARPLFLTHALPLALNEAAFAFRGPIGRRPGNGRGEDLIWTRRVAESVVSDDAVVVGGASREARDGGADGVLAVVVAGQSSLCCLRSIWDADSVLEVVCRGQESRLDVGGQRGAGRHHPR